MRIVLKKYSWIALTFLILITLHLKVATVGGNFGIALGFLLIPFWFYITFEIYFLKFKIFEFALLLSLVLLPFLTLSIGEKVEFFKTYGQYIISYFFVVRAYKKKLLISKKTIVKTLLLFQIFLMLFVILQFFIVKVVGSTSFYNVFGDLQLYYQRSEPGYERMKAFYLEPSYLGFIVVNIYWAFNYLTEKSKFKLASLLITIVTLILTKSAFAFISLFAIILFDMYHAISKKTIIYKIILSSFILLTIYLLLDKLSILFRIEEFMTNPDREITSGFMRIILPAQILYEMFMQGHYFGLTFGVLDSFVEDRMIIYGESGISNSFILIIGYFGILGFLMCAFLIFSFFKTNSRILKSFIILIFLNLNNSGAFVTSQYVFVSILIPILAIKLYENKIINNYSCTK